ncbi:hypothetical protein D8M04_10175 [Oceanobacillus piezotolerans]|uniref:YlbE-like protein n=1 Tax=Oceanobacillus piezotolerans TaxID=2448030 RepID=A0A498D6Z5_9BACI|nr:YlbE-like family protein [Oceanobacillus piezotolerans]RLL45216.1 hypothetical protein D8M04_10175 [Oceanobacillus piezotolerans]
MDKQVQEYLAKNPSLANFIRYNPVWYRYLTRDPSSIKEMEKEAKVFYGKTISQRVERINNSVQMLNMVMQFAGVMKD